MSTAVETDEKPAPYHVAHHTHRDVSGGWLRPAVFGAMDGLVSNLALMTGVAGGDVDTKVIVVTGLAGLAAGAFSMAAGSTPRWPRSASWSRRSWPSNGWS